MNEPIQDSKASPYQTPRAIADEPVGARLFSKSLWLFVLIAIVSAGGAIAWYKANSQQVQDFGVQYRNPPPPKDTRIQSAND